MSHNSSRGHRCVRQQLDGVTYFFSLFAGPFFPLFAAVFDVRVLRRACVHVVQLIAVVVQHGRNSDSRLSSRRLRWSLALVSSSGRRGLLTQQDITLVVLQQGTYVRCVCRCVLPTVHLKRRRQRRLPCRWMDQGRS